jgi:hypothetical protein
MADATGATLTGVFTEVTPLGDLRDGRHSETKCYVYMQVVGAKQGDIIDLHLIDSERRPLQTYRCPLDAEFRASSQLPSTIVVPLVIPHYTYGLHELAIEHDSTAIGSIFFDVKPMPNPFR